MSKVAFDSIDVVPKRPKGDPNGYDKATIIRELDRCMADSQFSVFGVVYWIINYVLIFNNDARKNVPLVLWDADVEYDNQLTALKKFVTLTRVICLKARQVGMTTLVITYFLYDMLFRPKSLVLILSRGEKEAQEQLKRIKDIYEALPYWMKSEVVRDTKDEWRLANGSVCFSLSSHKGDSFSATHVMIDEAALLYRSNISLQQVLLNLAPTVGQKGKLFLISKTDKSRPDSTFTKIYRGALRGKTEYTPSFISYDVVPGRTKEWYDRECELSMQMDGTLDYVWETYPAHPEEALAPLSVNKRFKKKWLDRCFEERDPIVSMVGDDLRGNAVAEFDAMGMERELPLINGLKIFELPKASENYVVIGDPGEGLATSDFSALSVMKVNGREQVATLAVRIPPDAFAFYLHTVGKFYNNAALLYELNEHGRAVDQWLKDNNSELKILKGWAATERSRKHGWTQNSASKNVAYHETAKRLRDGECKIYDRDTYENLSIIESGTNSAPKKMNDDIATAFVLSVAAIEFCITNLMFGLVTVN